MRNTIRLAGAFGVLSGDHEREIRTFPAQRARLGQKSSETYNL